MNPDNTYRQEVVDELNRLMEIFTHLRQAMLSRNPEQILEVVAQGESLCVSPALIGAPPEMMQDEEIRSIVQRLSRLQEKNRLLASSFRKLYRQILRPTENSESGVYGRSGNVPTPMAAPLLIHQVG